MADANLAASLQHKTNATYLALIDVLIRGLETAKQANLEGDATDRTFCAFAYGESGHYCHIFYIKNE